MRRYTLFAFFLALAAYGLFLIRPASALTTAQRYSGYILLQYERSGQTWYVFPETKQRYYLGNPSAGLRVMQHLALGINNADLAKVPVNGSSDAGDAAMRSRLSGRFLLATEDHGKIWYVWPKTKQRYLINSSTAAFWVMGHLSTGGSEATLAQIPIAPGFGPPTATVSGLSYTTASVNTSRGVFVFDIMKLDTTKSTLKVKTDTGNGSNCTNGCTTLPLLTYVTRRNAVAGMHGTYFCPSDYASCAGQTGSYFYPVYNSFNHVLINDDRIKYTSSPMIAIDTENVPHYYTHTKDFVSVTKFESTTGKTLQAAIGNSPALVENGQYVVNTATLDSKQATVKSYRGAIGWKGPVYYFLIVHSATVPDAGAVAAALGLDYAVNLDGGGSATMYTNGRYVLGPGRNLPNAIVLTP